MMAGPISLDKVNRASNQSSTSKNYFVLSYCLCCLVLGTMTMLPVVSRGTVAQSVERATPGEEVPGFDSRCGRLLSTGWVCVSIM